MGELSDKVMLTITVIVVILIVVAAIIATWSYYNPTPFSSGVGYVAAIISYCILGIALILCGILLGASGVHM